MPTKGYKYVQRRQNIVSFDNWGFPVFSYPRIVNVGCDKKRRFIVRADRTEIWLCGPLRCSLQQTFISPWVLSDAQLAEELKEYDTRVTNAGDTRTKTESNSNGRGPGG
jgi:hypothetical protein